MSHQGPLLGYVDLHCYTLYLVSQVIAQVPKQIYHLSNDILFDKRPIPPISTTTSSPSLRSACGFMNTPTPPGVPVMMSDPRCNVWPWLQKAMSFRTSKQRSEVLLSCLTCPLTVVLSSCASAAPNSLDATIQGPSGAYLSNDLLNDHCGTGPALPASFCQSRAETSFPTV